MEKNDLEKILELRTQLIQHYERLRDYKTNKNALMKEVDHAQRVHETIVAIDNILKPHVDFG